MLLKRESRPRHLDALGQLCIEGSEAANYLFQVPSDEEQAEQLRGVLQKIVHASEQSGRTEMPKVAAQLMELSEQLPSIAAADGLVSGFDRLLRLWEASRSGLF